MHREIHLLGLENVPAGKSYPVICLKNGEFNLLCLANGGSVVQWQENGWIYGRVQAYNLRFRVRPVLNPENEWEVEEMIYSAAGRYK